VSVVTYYGVPLVFPPFLPSLPFCRQGDDDDDGDIVCDETVVESSCEPDYDQGDNPCVVGCGHAPVPNPFNHNPMEAEKEQRPGACKNYECLCADSGCSRTWDVGCIKWYMQCQPSTQVCGSLSDAPTAVQDFNVGVSCVVAPTSANTHVCFTEVATAPSKSPVSIPQPAGDDDDTPGTSVGPGDDDDTTDTGTGKKTGYVPSTSGGDDDDENGPSGPGVVSGKKGGYGDDDSDPSGPDVVSGDDDDGPSGPGVESGDDDDGPSSPEVVSGKKVGYGGDDDSGPSGPESAPGGYDDSGPSGPGIESGDDDDGPAGPEVVSGKKVGYSGDDDSGPSGPEPVPGGYGGVDDSGPSGHGIESGDDDDDDGPEVVSGKKVGYGGDDDSDPSGPESVPGGYGGDDDSGPSGPGIESGDDDDGPSGPEVVSGKKVGYGGDDDSGPSGPESKPSPQPVDTESIYGVISSGSSGKPIPAKSKSQDFEGLLYTP
jgi:hypothetical protein